MIYEGDLPGSDGVKIGSAVDLSPGSGESEHFEWYDRARRGEDIVYFAIWESGRQVGQIFLHDIDWVNGDSLVGNHIFDMADRGRKIGTLSPSLSNTPHRIGDCEL